MMKHASGGYIALILASIGAAQTPTPAAVRIESRRPMFDARTRLQLLFGKVITYEEPILSWKDELDPAVQGPRMIPKIRSFYIPTEAFSAANAAVALDRTLEAYHQQVTGTHFQVLTSKLGYHVIPVRAHSERGDLVPISSLLDVRMTSKPAATPDLLAESTCETPG